MSVLNIYNTKGETVGQYQWPEELLELEKGDQAVHDVVVAHRVACRAGTASTLSKGQVAGSNKKPWRQKGLGRARAGYKQSPLWRGGAVAFGPKPGVRKLKVNKKVGALAFKRILSEKISSESIKVLENFDLTEVKSRSVTDMIKALGLEGRTLIVMGNSLDANIKLASRNLENIRLARADNLSVYELLDNRSVLVSTEALDIMKGRISGSRMEGVKQ